MCSLEWKNAGAGESHSWEDLNSIFRDQAWLIQTYIHLRETQGVARLSGVILGRETLYSDEGPIASLTTSSQQAPTCSGAGCLRGNDSLSEDHKLTTREVSQVAHLILVVIS